MAGKRPLFAAVRALAVLPLPAAHALGAAVGRLAALLPNRYRRVTRRNLELCFPELDAPARAALARASLVETGKALFETPRVWSADRAGVEALVREVVGAEHLAAARAKGRGIIFAGPHLGAWELVGLHLGLEVPIAVMFRPPRFAALGELALASRARLGATVVPTDAGGVKALYKALQRGEGVGILPDQDPGYDAGVLAPFFGIPALTMTLLSRLARKSGAAVLVTWAERLPAGRGFRVHFAPVDEAVYDADPTTAATALNQAIEAAVRQAPAQYQWSYKRFRRHARGVRAPSVYG